MTRPPLYPFQADDIGSMSDMITERGYAICHWEQGLGKSRAAIEIADALKFKHILVLCPAIGRVSWAEEPDKWGVIPRKQIVIDKGAAISRLRKIGSHASIVTCTYDLCRNPEVRDALRDFGFDFAVLDEFQQLRTPTAKRTKSVYDKRQGVLAKIPKLMLLSGTPVVSWPLDLWTHLARFGPERIQNEHGRRMGFEEFRDRYHATKKMPNPHSRHAPPIIRIFRAKNLEDLHRRMEGWAVRRRKTDVLTDLPPMVTRRWPITVTKKARDALTDALVRELPPHLSAELLSAETDQEMDIVMRKIAASSAHVAAVQRLTGLAKAASVAKQIKDELDESTYKMGIFAWNLDVVDVLKNALATYQPLVITGGTSASARQQAVQQFQNTLDKRVFIGQIAACGTALTLTAASRCIFVQQSWTPGDNAQAAARFHRIGQKDSVDCRIAFMPDTLDEPMSRVLHTKTQAAWEIVDA